MKHIMKCFLVSVLSMAVCQVVQGHTYHVKKDGTGDFTSIQACAKVLVAGDVCVVHEGTYNERVQFYPGQSGAPGQMITFCAEPAGSVTMQGFNSRYADYLRIEGFNITDTPSGWRGGGVWLESNNVEVVNNYLYEITFAAIIGIWKDPKCENIYIAGNRIYHSDAGIIADGKNWVVEYNEVERLFEYGNYSCDYARFFGENIVFRGNYFHGTFSTETGSSHVDAFQTFDNNSNGALISNILIEKNICLGFYHQGVMGEADYYNNTSNITIKNNIFAHATSWGVCVDGNIKNVAVLNNVFADINYHGVGFRENATGSVFNNIFYNTGTSYWATTGAEIEGDYNLVFNAQDPPEIGPHDIIGLDPGFTDYANDDYSLLADSPAIDHGGEVDVLEDIENNVRPIDGDGNGINLWDIGPYEFNESLMADTDTFSESLGGVIRFTLNGGVANSYRTYLILGSMSGTEPGLLLPGGEATLPINKDPLTGLIFAYLNTPLFEDFFGVLDAEGQGQAQICSDPLAPGFVGMKMHFAYCLNNPFNFASNPFEIEIVP